MLESTAIQRFETSDFTASHLAQSHQHRTRIQQLEDDITELAAHIDAATFRWLELVREFDECKVGTAMGSDRVRIGSTGSADLG